MPSCRTTRTSASRRTETPTNSTTAAPASPYGRRRRVIAGSSAGRALHAVEGAAQDVAELRTGDAPQHGDEAGRHQGDEHPAGYVAAVAVAAGQHPGLERDYQGERSQRRGHGSSW